MVSGTEKRWLGGEGSIDRDEGKGGVLQICEELSVPGPLLEIRALERGDEGEGEDGGGVEAVGVGGEDDEQLGGCVVGVDLSVDVDGVRYPVKRGGEVLGAKVLINERSLRRKSEDDVLDDRRLVEGLVLDACRDILGLTTLWLHELKGVRVSGQGDPPGLDLGLG